MIAYPEETPSSEHDRATDPGTEHVSYSRLQRWESCPHSYKLHYIDGLPSEPSEPLAFGRALHAVLERLYAEQILAERVGTLLIPHAFEYFQEAFFAERLTGREIFCEGLDLLKDYCLGTGVVDPAHVLAVEKPFEIRLGKYALVGYIDRIDRIDEETIEVLDYKTNRQLYLREEVDDSLQLAIYELAVRRLYPWAKRVRLSYVMLRHRAVRQTVERDDRTIEGTERYVEALARAIETATEYPSRIGSNCAYCDFRRQCGAYAEALKGVRREELTTDPREIGALSRERQEVAALANVLYARQREIDGIIKEHLKQRAEPMNICGAKYTLLKTTSLRHPLKPTLQVLANATGRTEEDLLPSLVTIDKDRLARFLEKTSETLGPSRARVLKEELAAVAESSVSTRLWVKNLAPVRLAPVPASPPVSPQPPAASELSEVA